MEQHPTTPTTTNAQEEDNTDIIIEILLEIDGGE
jgi:hypothetical protein